MRFKDLVQRVEDNERLLELQRSHAGASWRGLRSSWREGWTPTRILLAGLLSGFLVGRARPVRRIAGLPSTRWVQIATSLWSLGASFRAKDAANTAEAAADDAAVASEVAADTAEAAATGTGPRAASTADLASGAVASAPGHPPGVPEAPRRVDPQWDSEPRPAEAATELSER